MGEVNCPQDGGPLTREQWFGQWPISRKGNEWVRAFGFTYTLKIEPNGCRLIVVGPGGVREESIFLDAQEAKAWLWPEHLETPLDVYDLEVENECLTPKTSVENSKTPLSA